MDEVPGLQAALLALDHEDALAGDDEEVLLAALAVVQAVPLSRLEHVDPEAEPGPLLLAFEAGVLAALLALYPGHVAGVEDEPPLALGDEAVLGRRQLCLSHRLSSVGVRKSIRITTRRGVGWLTSVKPASAKTLRAPTCSSPQTISLPGSVSIG